MLDSIVRQYGIDLSSSSHNALMILDEMRLQGGLEANAVIVLMMGAKSMLTAMLSWSFEEGQSCCLFMFPYHFTLPHSAYCPIACYPQGPPQSANE